MKFSILLLTSSIVLVGITLCDSTTIAQAQTAPPPSLGQDTKGEPAVEEPEAQSETALGTSATEEPEPQASTSPFGTATVTESRRESGQVYLIELEHSSGAKQYIEENDSDGNIESEATDIEDTPNLPKWRLGSW